MFRERLKRVRLNQIEPVRGPVFPHYHRYHREFRKRRWGNERKDGTREKRGGSRGTEGLFHRSGQRGGQTWEGVGGKSTVRSTDLIPEGWEGKWMGEWTTRMRNYGSSLDRTS